MSDLERANAKLASIESELVKNQQGLEKDRVELKTVLLEQNLAKIAETSATLGDVSYAKRLHFGPVYADPSIESARYWTREPDQGFQVLPIDGKWLLTLFSDGTVGWLPKTDVLILPPVTEHLPTKTP